MFALFLHCSHVHFGVPVVPKLCALCYTIHTPSCPTDMSDNIHTFFKRVDAQSKAQPAPKAKPRAEPLKDRCTEIFTPFLHGSLQR